MKDPVNRRTFMKIAGTSIGSSPRIQDVELTLREFSGTVGIQQLLKEGVSV